MSRSVIVWVHSGILKNCNAFIFSCLTLNASELWIFQCQYLIDCYWVQDLTVPIYRGLNKRALCAPHQFMGALLLCWSSRWPPDLYSWCPLAPRSSSPDTRLSEAKASHSQRMWAEVSSSAPHLLHNGLSDSPIRWRCLLRVLCPVRKPLTALDCVLLKNRNLALAPRQGAEISSRACTS